MVPIFAETGLYNFSDFQCGGTKKGNLYKKIFPEGDKVLQKMLHLV